LSSTLLAAALIVIAAAAISAAGFRLALRLRPRFRDEEHTDVKSVYFSMVGVLYAILLAFVVVVAWEQFNAAKEATHTEATRLSNLLRDAGAFPPADRQQVRVAIVDYVEAVVEDEYDAMAEGRPSERATTAYERIWTEFYGVDVKNEPAITFYAQSLSRLNELGEARRLRVLASRSTIPVPLWILLIGGGMLTIAWLYPFHMSNVRTQTVAIATIGAFTGFILFLVYALQHPFTGEVAIDASVYQELVTLWKGRW
jgi:hypothetical protein